MPFNVLITAGSRRVPLVRAFRDAIAALGGRLIVSDINPLSPAVHMADAAYRVPLSTEPDYIESITQLCRTEHIRLLVPTIDDELPVFGEAAEHFDRLGVTVAVSPESTSVLCNDKFALCHHLRAAGLRAAESWLPDALPEHPSFPLFIKPRIGRGSVNAFAIRTPRELDFFLEYVNEPVVQEYLAGPEFTLDMMCGFDYAPRAIVPRERIVVRAGVSDQGRTVNDQRMIDLAIRCAEVIPFVGAINIQCRMVDGVPIVFEIDPRFSGGIPLTIAAGADFPRMLVDMVRGRAVPRTIGQFRADLWMTKFEDSIYMERGGAGALRLPTQPVDEAESVRPRRVA